MKDRLPERQERSLDSRVSVFNEMDPLQDLVIWGEPGCETILGQLLPENISLFWKEFKVPEARKEFRFMQSVFEAKGINVIRMKDVIAENPEDTTNMPESIEELSRLIKMRGHEFYEFYSNHPDYVKGGRFGEYQGKLSILDQVDGVLEEDAEKYGEQKAIALNWTLCISNDLPLANIMYARDQSNALGDKIVLSRMKREIRQPEVELFKRGYELLGYGDKLVSVEDGNFEGGDAYIFGSNCLIGADVRTNKEGIADIYKKIRPGLEERGIKLFAVKYDGEPRKPGQEMEAMHLDTFMMPLNENGVLACPERVDLRRVELVHYVDGKIEFTDMGTLKDFLKFNNEDEIKDISEEEQINYATNFLHLGHNVVVVPLEDKDHARVNNLMRGEGLEVIPAGIKELVGGYGAVHCMTAAIRRG
jgi:arginine deiminase